MPETKPIDFVESIRLAFKKFDALPDNHRLKTVACLDCNDDGRVAYMEKRNLKVEGPTWVPIWLGCKCCPDQKLYEHLQDVVEAWANPLCRPKEVVEYNGEIAIFTDAQVWLLEHAMNGTPLRNPLHAERPWPVWQSLSWLVGNHIPQEWADTYESGKTEQEQVDEFFA